jgi:hypothetical protein
MACEGPINGASPCGEAKQISSAKPHPTRPAPTPADGPRNPRRGGL